MPYSDTYGDLYDPVSGELNVKIGFGSTWQSEPVDIAWTDVTDCVLQSPRVRTRRGASSARGQVDVGTLGLSLLNIDRRFDPLYVDGPYYGDLKPGVPIQVTLYPNGSAGIIIFTGTVATWPQRYDRSNRFAFVPIDAYDGFDKLSRAKIPRSVLETEILADDPEAYWPLDESSGTFLTDRSGNGHDGTFHDVTFSTEQVAAGLGRSVEFAQGEGSRALPAASPIVTAYPVTLEAAVFYEGELVGNSQTVIWHSVDTSITNWMGLLVGGSGATNRALFGIVNNGVIRSALGTTVLSGDVHHIVVVLNSSTNWDIWVDGVEEVTTNPVAGAPAWPASWTFWALGNTAGSSKGDYGLGGRMNATAVYDTALSGSRIAEHASAALAPLDAQSTDERIDYILTALEWPTTLRSLDAGASLLGPAEFKAGDGALEYIRLCNNTEDGLLFIAPDGTLTTYNRFWRYLDTLATTPQFTFSDTSDTSYAEFDLDLDDELLVNVARLTRRGGAEQVASDQTSVDLYGQAEVQLSDLLHQTDDETRAQAEWTVATRSTPLPRIPKIRVPLHSYSAADQATVAALDLGHRVSVVRTPLVGDPIELDLVIDGVSHDIGIGEWWWEAFVSPVPEATVTPFLWDSSLLDSTDIWAY